MSYVSGILIEPAPIREWYLVRHAWISDTVYIYRILDQELMCSVVVCQGAEAIA
jgi:hypothetical protein